jgi:L-amino acid N-acyltransferase YncA
MRVPTEHGFFEINAFPGCNQVAVINHHFIERDWRCKGLGRANMAKQLELARELGYDMLVCTIRSNNIAQRKLLIASGWMQFTQFVNRETTHEVEFWGRTL